MNDEPATTWDENSGHFSVFHEHKFSSGLLCYPQRFTLYSCTASVLYNGWEEARKKLKLSSNVSFHKFWRWVQKFDIRRLWWPMESKNDWWEIAIRHSELWKLTAIFKSFWEFSATKLNQSEPRMHLENVSVTVLLLKLPAALKAQLFQFKKHWHSKWRRTSFERCRSTTFTRSAKKILWNFYVWLIITSFIESLSRKQDFAGCLEKFKFEWSVYGSCLNLK